MTSGCNNGMRPSTHISPSMSILTVLIYVRILRIDICGCDNGCNSGCNNATMEYAQLQRQRDASKYTHCSLYVYFDGVDMCIHIADTYIHLFCIYMLYACIDICVLYIYTYCTCIHTFILIPCMHASHSCRPRTGRFPIFSIAR